MDSSEDQMRAWRNAEQQDDYKFAMARSKFMQIMKEVKKVAYGTDGLLVIEVPMLRAILRKEL